MMNQLRSSAAQFSPRRRTVAAAMLMGSVAGALLAFEAVAADGAEVKIDNFAFTPAELTVPVGTTVTWVNRDDTPHTVVDKNKAFRSKPLDTKDSFTFTFASAGTFDYVCSLHPNMSGKIIVK
jgi:plastocyanin